MGQRVIYSPDHNFLLLKNMKVGSTALEVALSMVLPDNAVVTPKTSRLPAWKIENDTEYDGYRPRNYKDLRNHAPYDEIEKYFDLSNAKAYLFVRNPYDSVLSHFFHRLFLLNQKVFDWDATNQKEKNILLDKYFNNDLGWEWYEPFRRQYYDSKGNMIVNKFLFYEKGIENEINQILPLHEISTISLNNVKEKEFRPKHLKPKDVFREQDLDTIRKSWDWEFDFFKYER